MTYKTIQQQTSSDLGALRSSQIAALVKNARECYGDINGIVIEIRRNMMGELTKAEIEKGDKPAMNRFILDPSDLDN